MRIFGSERMDSMLVKLGLQEGEAIVHPWINKALEKAQQKVEARNFDMRKNVLKFDNVMNDQRKVIFERRREIMSDESVEDHVADMREEVVDKLVALHIRPQRLCRGVGRRGSRRRREGKAQYRAADRPMGRRGGHRRRGDSRNACSPPRTRLTPRKVEKNTPALMRMIEKQFVLQSLDFLWRDHLIALDHLRQVVGWRGMAQRDPLNEYKSEALELFKTLMGHWDERVTQQLMRVDVSLRGAALRADGTAADADVASGAGGAWRRHGRSGDPRGSQRPPRRGGLFGRADRAAPPAEPRDPHNPATWGKVGRNESCPCGSGKKYKHCHGALV